MPLFTQSQSKLTRIKEQTFNLEKDLQALVEENLDELFGLTFVSTELTLNNLRIDTFAYDSENSSFVIIEYKKGQKFSVIDQGYAYLALLLNNKADFILEYNEKNNRNLGKNDIDWSQSKVIFIANSFTTYQQEAIGFQDLPMELWEVKKYENNMVALNQIQASDKSESIEKITGKSDVKKVSKEVKQYSIEDHLEGKSNKAIELFDEFSNRVMDLDSRFQIDPKKSYIGYKIDWKVVIHVNVYKSSLRVQFRRTKPGDLNDPEGRLIHNEKSMEYYNQHTSDVIIESQEDIDYVVPLVREVLKQYD